MPGRPVFAAACGAVAAITAVPAWSQTAPLCAERPGLATGACLVAPGAVQLETGLLSWSTDGQGQRRSTERTLGDAVLRWGVSRTDEIRAGLALDIRQRFPGHRSEGPGDLGLGYKRRLTDADAAWSLALLAAVKLPTARRTIGNRRVEGGLRFAADYDLGRDWSLTLTGEGDWAADEERRGHHAALSLAGSLAHEWSSRWATAVDVLIGRDDVSGAAASTSAQAGLSATFLATPKLQLDLEADAGIGRGAPDLVLQTGLTSLF